jgi:hypothetical protein
MLAGRKRGKGSGGNPFNLSHLHKGSQMEFPMLAVGGREREKERDREREREEKDKSCPLRESEIDYKILKLSLLYLGSLSCRFSRPGLPL